MRGPLATGFLAAGLIVFTTTVLVAGAPLLVPVVEAVVVWFILNALADACQRIPVVGAWLPRGSALLLAGVVVFVLGFLVLQSSLRAAAEIAPRTAGFRVAVEPTLTRMAELLGLPRDQLSTRLMQGFNLEGLFRSVVAATVSTISHFGVVGIYVMFLLVDQQFFEAKLVALVPDPTRRARMRGLMLSLGNGIKSYLWVMTQVSVLTAVLCYAVMRFVGMEYAGFWALTIFFLNYIPTIGTILGTVLPVGFAMLQFSELSPVLLTLLGIGAVQVVVGNILMPKMAGSSLNISLFVTILALFAWGAIWGVTGMFIAMPLTAMLILTFAAFDATRPLAILLSRTGEVAPPDPRPA